MGLEDITVEATCRHCNGAFVVHVQKYCCKKCADAARMTGEEKECECCGRVYYVPANAIKESRFCSEQCKKVFSVGQNSPHFRGGFLDPNRGHRILQVKRPGFKTTTVAEHRIVAARAIGRTLETREKVIHLNGMNNDNRPENLFICGSNSEMIKIKSGVIPHPKASNLDTYR